VRKVRALRKGGPHEVKRQINIPDPRGRGRERGRSWRSNPLQTTLCREAGCERGSDETNKRVEGEKGGNSIHLSAHDDTAATTPCSITLEQGTPFVSVEIEGISRSLIINNSS